MLFTSPQELTHIIPTSKFAKIETLISRLNAEEMNSLYPLVGMPLLQQFRTDYNAFSREDGGIWSCAERSEENETKVTILRTAQEVLLYSYLANHSAILQSSFNMGGGWNSPSTGDYDALDAKANDRLDKDLWHSARRAKENLLLFLEMDARSHHVYTEKWKESDYFYLHKDLLFTTPSELHPLFINLGDTPHLNFQSYVSTLHDCQDGYIAGTIGYPLLQALIDRKYSTVPSPDELAEGGSPDGASLPSPTDLLDQWRTLDRHIRTALANFAAYEHEGAKHDHLRNRGQSQLSIATHYIHDHYLTFSPFIPEDTPIYIPPKPDPSVGLEQDGSPVRPKKDCANPPFPPPPHRGTVFSLLH